MFICTLGWSKIYSCNLTFKYLQRRVVIFLKTEILNFKIWALQVLLKSYSYVTYASQQNVWVINLEGKAPSIKRTFCNKCIKVCFNCPYTLIYLYKCGRTLLPHLNNNISLIYAILTQLNCWYKFKIIFQFLLFVNILRYVIIFGFVWLKTHATWLSRGKTKNKQKWQLLKIVHKVI